jgi:hypothetical protein
MYSIRLRGFHTKQEAIQAAYTKFPGQHYQVEQIFSDQMGREKKVVLVHKWISGEDK